MVDDKADLPSQAAVETALTELLRSTGKALRPKDVYSMLAEQFALTSEQRERAMKGKKTRHWENRVQWARQRLVTVGVMSQGPRGMWSLSEGSRSNSDWTEPEVHALVTDYFDMLRKEVEGLPYSKTEHRRNLMATINRTEAAIERKHQNVSAVLQEHAYPWISGYKPLANYQRSLPDFVLPHLFSHGDMLDRLIEIPVEPTNDADTFTEAPQEGFLPPEPGDPIAYNFDVASRDANNRALGANGEAFVLAAEMDRLKKLGRSDLAANVEHVAITKGDGLGYDIASFDPDGRAIFIEVKTTRGGPLTPFYVSEMERLVAISKGSAFRIYRVFNFGKNPQIFTLAGPMETTLELRPIAYRVGVKSMAKA